MIFCCACPGISPVCNFVSRLSQIVWFKWLCQPHSHFFVQKTCSKMKKLNIFAPYGPFFAIFWYVSCDLRGFYLVVQRHRGAHSKRTSNFWSQNTKLRIFVIIVENVFLHVAAWADFLTFWAQKGDIQKRKNSPPPKKRFPPHGSPKNN